MITLSNADTILKSVYLDAIADQINCKTNPFYAKIAKNSDHIVGKDIVFTGRTGLTGGLSSTTEDGSLPSASSTKYVQFRADLKNIYGTIELTDKAIRASESSAGSLVNVLNSEMESLLASAKFNFGRMLYGNGSGVLAAVVLDDDVTLPNLKVDFTHNFVEGMQVVIKEIDGSDVVASPVTVIAIDHANSIITLDNALTGALLDDGQLIYLENSKDNEIFGLDYIFNSTLTNFYGLTRSNVPTLLGKTNSAGNTALTLDMMLNRIDSIELNSGTTPDMILMSFVQRKKYFDLVKASGTNFDYMALDGGFKALSFNGIPIIADRFVTKDAVFFVNTSDFKLQQLCDWSWITGDNGSILHQMENKAAYQATLVKYANLICTRANAQEKINGLSIA